MPAAASELLVAPAAAGLIQWHLRQRFAVPHPARRAARGALAPAHRAARRGYLVRPQLTRSRPERLGRRSLLHLLQPGRLAGPAPGRRLSRARLPMDAQRADKRCLRWPNRKRSCWAGSPGARYPLRRSSRHLRLADDRARRTCALTTRGRRP